MCCPGKACESRRRQAKGCDSVSYEEWLQRKDLGKEGAGRERDVKSGKSEATHLLGKAFSRAKSFDPHWAARGWALGGTLLTKK